VKNCEVKYAPYSWTPIKANEVIGEIGIVFYRKSGDDGSSVVIMHHIGDRDSFCYMPCDKARRYSRFLKSFCNRITSVAKEEAEKFGIGKSGKVRRLNP